MVPEAFVALDALPTTPNGKLDRSALPSPPEAASPASANSGSLLETVRQIWCEVLRIPELADTEDLFDLGGHSITMTQISVRILDRLGVEVPLYAFFDAPTVRGMTAVVADLRAQG
ncbi:phosphopantetheine-binding protein [Streptomyces sp. NPDC002513]